MGEFVPGGPTDAVGEGGMAAYQLGPRRVAVARIEDAFYAFDDVCTHAACSLADGELEGDTVVCPCHFGQFDLATGTVLDGPPPAPVQVYRVREQAGTIEVEL
jgi:3-phenylpropionate/trans-cinnamate dioxygenase ferredoxin subunit